ncbi:MAG: delta-60 repeat domain-containing protein [Chloroflexota bacterium]
MRRNINLRNSKRPARLGTTLLTFVLILSAAGCGGGAPDVSPTATLAASQGTSVVPTRESGPPDAPGTSTGTLDSTFGDGGRVITDLNGKSDEVQAVVVQPDGKIVAAGTSWVFPQDRPRVALARYNADGTLDKSFGDSGFIITGMTDDEWDYSVPHALALQPDGKLLVAGTSYSNDDGRNVFAVARFYADGTLDEDFGSGGRTLTAIDTSEDAGNDEAHAIALAGDGTIVLAGVTGGFPTDFAAARYLPDGTLDTSFGDGGTVITDLGGTDQASAVAIQEDGKIVVAGRGVNNDDDWAMLRYLPDGSLDEAFGNEGKVSADFGGGEDWATAVAVRRDGRIVVGGVNYVGVVICRDENGLTRGCDKFGFAVVQYNADGVVDESFGEGGEGLYEFEATSGASALVLQPDGKVVLAGHYDYDDFAVVRTNADGTLDSSFGTDGMVRTPFGLSMDVAYAVALQPDGKIVAAGTGTVDEENGLNSDFALTRYNAK